MLIVSRKVTVELETALFDGQVRLRAAASHCAMKSVYRFGGMPLINILDYSEDGFLVKRPDSFDSIIWFF